MRRDQFEKIDHFGTRLNHYFELKAILKTQSDQAVFLVFRQRNIIR
jgi:hypothetical protein